MVIKDTKYQVVINTVLIILSLMCVMPFILLLSSSITSETALVKTGYRFWPTEIDLSAYKYLLMDSTSIVRGKRGNTLYALVSAPHGGNS